MADKGEETRPLLGAPDKAKPASDGDAWPVKFLSRTFGAPKAGPAWPFQFLNATFGKPDQLEPDQPAAASKMTVAEWMRSKMGGMGGSMGGMIGVYAGLSALLVLWYVSAIFIHNTYKKNLREHGKAEYDSDLLSNDKRMYTMDLIRRDLKPFIISTAIVIPVVCLRIGIAIFDYRGDFMNRTGFVTILLTVVLAALGFTLLGLWIKALLVLSRNDPYREYNSNIQKNLTTNKDVLSALSAFVKDESKVSPYIWPTRSQLYTTYMEADTDAVKKIVFSYRLAQYYKRNIGSEYAYSRKAAADLFAPLDKNSSSVRNYSLYMHTSLFNPNDASLANEEKTTLSQLIKCENDKCPSGRLSFSGMYDRINKSSKGFTFDIEQAKVSESESALNDKYKKADRFVTLLRNITMYGSFAILCTILLYTFTLSPKDFAHTTLRAVSVGLLLGLVLVVS